MTPAQARTAIKTLYVNEIKAIYPTLKIAVDNGKFTPPDSEDWVRLSVIFNTAPPATLGRPGNRKFRRTGFISIQVFSPILTRTDTNDAILEDSINIFDGRHIATQLWSFAGRGETIGIDDDKYFQQNAVIEFEYENIR